ncbi:Ribosomal protein L18e [Artemisia annua]|uniref:Ribosomal protein L18e n=1 Tax=Artemisia annua TaxID=35608 RepID=A0A2U1QCD2_ARTAN|nr:Ribosomal protein L18e [Artemisia annua]
MATDEGNRSMDRQIETSSSKRMIQPRFFKKGQANDPTKTKLIWNNQLIRSPLQTPKIIFEERDVQDDKIVVVVETVTDDPGVDEIPCMKVTALRFIETARAWIKKAGGVCFAFDQLALRDPLGQNTVLVIGPKNCCEVNRHFGKPPGVPHSHTKPYVR